MPRRRTSDRGCSIVHRSLFVFPQVCGVAGTLLFGVAGCGPDPPPKPAQQEPEIEKIEQLKGTVTGKGWYVPWKVRDPKDPTRSVPVMIANAETGAMKNDDGNVRVQLRKVRAQLFREGKPAAYVEAQEVSANRRDRVVIGKGNVIVHSLSDPPDTVVRADRMRWDTRSGTIVASGNAQVTRRLANGQRATSFSNRVLFDTRLKDFVIE
ncbi:MAG: hypothetical protein RMJ43_05950 [Chloroherpetonaceae bacterium]|nr:hypothetical protein [Chthonomonadaceae bacterium]MDW8207360.1 hypothetical protein [Chloroherpetonaceae bacterium]